MKLFDVKMRQFAEASISMVNDADSGTFPVFEREGSNSCSC